MIEFSNRLKLIRNQYKLSQEELGDRLQLNKSTISRYESDEIQPTLDHLTEISNYFNVSIDWLVGKGSIDLYIR